MPAFNTADLLTLGPEIALSIFAFLALLPDLFTRRGNRLAGQLSIVMAVATLAMVVIMWNQGGAEPVAAFSGAFRAAAQAGTYGGNLYRGGERGAGEGAAVRAIP